MQTNRFPKEMQVKSRSHSIEQLSGSMFVVTSGTSGSQYTIVSGDLDIPTICSCDWGKYREPGIPCGCSHVVAVQNYLAETYARRRISVWSKPEDVARQHRQTFVLGDGLILTTRKIGS